MADKGLFFPLELKNSITHYRNIMISNILSKKLHSTAITGSVPLDKRKVKCFVQGHNNGKIVISVITVVTVGSSWDSPLPGIDLY